MVILDVQLWELGTQRLHQGLSETILVNTDVRELKKKEENWCSGTIFRLLLRHLPECDELSPPTNHLGPPH